MTQERIVVGISGASGVIYGIRVLQILREVGLETHLVVSKAAEQTRALETNFTSDQLKSLAHHVYSPADMGAAISSGSFITRGMIIAPCSVKTLAEIASGACSSLLTRAADVTLKERRRLVLMLRETPLHLGHLRNMVTATENGAIIFPPVPAFYTKPETLDDIVTHSVARALDLFGIHTDKIKRWT